MEKSNGKGKALIDTKYCQACGICVSRCPEKAIGMQLRSSPLEIGIDTTKVSDQEMHKICRAAHMYPDQIVCYCRRVQVKEIVAAILAGAKTPEDVARMTGARTGCGVLCINGVIRVLRASGLELKHAAGYQWYGNTISIWTLPDDVMKKFDKEFYLIRDRKAIDEVFQGGEK
jgi:bacterioferritin-associated ferredoxin/ferredoxin